jgi:helix-turn-helix protein
VKYITPAEAAVHAGVSERRIRALAKNGQIHGAQLFAGRWLIPQTFTITRGLKGPPFYKIGKAQ